MRRLTPLDLLRDWQNIGRKLPLLTTVLLSVAISALSWTAYREMKREVISSAGDHVMSVSRQLASVFAESQVKLRREGTPVSRDSLIHAALLSSNATAREAARQRLEERAKIAPMFAVELWDAHGVRVLASAATANEVPKLVATNSIVAPLIARHDTVLTDVRVPVIGEQHDTLGFVRELSRVSSAQSKQVLGSLIGGQAILLIGNAQGDVWTDLDRRVDGPSARNTATVTTAATGDGTRWIGALSVVPGTPWLIWVARPEADVLARVHAFLLRMLAVSLIVVVVGAVGARLLSAHIIAPLTDVTHAAESVAHGDYSIRVATRRRDEVGRLGKAFNTMATSIQTASVELENQQVELESQQVELEESNEELRNSVAMGIRALETAERARVRAAAIVAGALDAIITIDDDDRIVEFNPAAERVFGYTAADATGRPIADLISVPDAEGSADATEHRLHTGDRMNGRRVEVSAVRADGKAFSVELSVSRVPITGAPMFTCFVRDLSDRKQLEAQLQQAQKMEAVGRLAGGVAHDFNNMLTVMISYTDLVLADASIQDTIRSDLVQVRSAADRAAVLTRQLLAFSRKQVLRPVVLDVNEVVGGVVTMLARVMPETIRLSTALGTSIDSVFVDRGQLEQVLMNLAVNAGDAMPDGGCLAIETTNAELDDTFAGLHAGGVSGSYVVLSVRDTGTGMDAATRERIFEPFFTTKPVGQGTGLGLATVYGIVQQSGGSIYVYSEPGHGTIFKVYFPAHRDVCEVQVASVEVAGTSEPMAILLVEDDVAVRDATRAVLRSFGHQVSMAHDVASALAIVRSGAAFDVVVTDAVMPGRSGLELAEILADERPDLPVVLMSGYAEETLKFDPSQLSGVFFIEKPFTAQGIANALAAATSAPAMSRR